MPRPLRPEEPNEPEGSNESEETGEFAGTGEPHGHSGQPAEPSGPDRPGGRPEAGAGTTNPITGPTEPITGPTEPITGPTEPNAPPTEPNTPPVEPVESHTGASESHAPRPSRAPHIPGMPGMPGPRSSQVGGPVFGGPRGPGPSPLDPRPPDPRPGERRPWLRTVGAALTALSALAATSLVAGSAVADRRSMPCALGRTEAHHSEGVDSWNAAYPRPKRALDALLVFLSFPDARPRTSPDVLTADYFPATSRFYERASYGRFTLRPHPHRTWVRMPRPSTAYRIRRDWDDAHRAAYLKDAVKAANPHIDFGRYDIVYFVADPDAPGVDSDATKVVNFDRPISVDGTSLRRIVTVFERHPPDRNVLAHETGHVFDLPDLYHRPSDGKGDWDTYVGDWDVMGSQFGLAPELFAWHKWRLGWLDAQQVVCVQGGGDTRLALEPLSAPPGRPQTVPAAMTDQEPSDSEAPYPYRTGDPRAARASDAPSRTAGNPSSRTAGSTVWAAPVGAAQGSAGPLRTAKLVVVRTGRSSAIALEARSAWGNDAAACTQGVLVYRVRSETESGGGPVEVIDAHPRSAACWNDSVYPALADAPIRTGEHFRVPHERVRIDVRVGERTRTGAWRVTISTR